MATAANYFGFLPARKRDGQPNSEGYGQIVKPVVNKKIKEIENEINLLSTVKNTDNNYEEAQKLLKDRIKLKEGYENNYSAYTKATKEDKKLKSFKKRSNALTNRSRLLANMISQPPDLPLADDDWYKFPIRRTLRDAVERDIPSISLTHGRVQ